MMTFEEEFHKANSEWLQGTDETTWPEACFEHFKDWQSPKEKIKIPQFVADWIEKEKGEETQTAKLPQCLENIRKNEYTGKKETTSKLAWWLHGFCLNRHTEALLRAWLDGYEIEKPELYYIHFINNDEYEYLNQDKHSGSIFIDDKIQENGVKTKFTLKEIKAIDERYLAFAEKVEMEE